MRALVVNELGGRFNPEDVDIASPIGVSKPEVNLDLNNFERDIPMYATLYLQGRINLDDLVSKTISLRDVNHGCAA
jgi:S-(hydroxymethyl)glutathione dehydrogenase/alcohol dehydrogenase